MISACLKPNFFFVLGVLFRCNKLIMSNFLWESRLRVSNANVQVVGHSEQFVLSSACKMGNVMCISKPTLV